MRDAGRGRWWAAGAAFLFALAACAPPASNTGNVVLVSPTPVPTPTPTTAFAASAAGFHVGEVGIAYAPVALTATGGVQPYHWSVATGSLPPGLAIGAGGTVSGNPTAAGHFAFTIQASDAGDSSAPIPGAIDVAAALTVSLNSSCASSCNVELGCVNACGAFGQQSGGVAPFAYSLTAGQVPAGTALSGLSLKGTFAGLTGYLRFTVQVTDALGASATVSPTFWMYPHISLVGVTCGNANTPGKCSVVIPYSGGTPGQRLSMASSAWVGARRCGTFTAAAIVCEQPALSVTFQPGNAVVTLTYGPNSTFTYGTLTVLLTSADTCGPGAACSASAAITVNG